MKEHSLKSAQSRRKTMIGSIILASLAIHGVMLMIFGLWTVASYFSRPEARFEVKQVVKIPPRTREHRMNVAKYEAMTPKPVLNDKIVSTRPTAFALPDLPRLELDQVAAVDPSQFASDQLLSLVGSAGIGLNLGTGLNGGGGDGAGLSFFGIETGGERVLLLFDVSSSVVNKANQSGVPLEKIQEETVRLVENLPVTASFSLIQFTGNYLPFTDELIPAKPANKQSGREWVEQRWVTRGTMAASQSGVVQNFRGVVGVLEKAVEMRPDVIFLISDASFQWRPGGGGGFQNIPDKEVEQVLKQLEVSPRHRIPLHFIAFQPKENDAKNWQRWARRTGGEFRELKRE